MKITNVVDSAYLIRFCSAGAYLKYLWLRHDLRLGVQEVVTKPWSDGIGIDTRGTDEVVNLDNIVLFPKLAKKSKPRHWRWVGNREISAMTVGQKNEISRQLVFAREIFFQWTP
jgi:hypothetical protein